MTDSRNISLPNSPKRAGLNVRLKTLCILILGTSGVCTFITATHAQQFSSEKDVLGLRLGQRVKIDDGSCPAGQVKEISGTKMTSDGVVWTRKCIPRVATKRK
jgi:hypothetical protein